MNDYRLQKVGKCGQWSPVSYKLILEIAANWKTYGSPHRVTIYPTVAYRITPQCDWTFIIFRRNQKTGFYLNLLETNF